MITQTDLILPYATKELGRIIRVYYPTMPTKIISLVTGVSIEKIYREANALGVKKSPEYIDAMLKASYEKLAESGKSHRFVKGQVPPNKGKKLPPEVVEKMRPTMFKPGHLPHNTNYDGHISIRADKTGKSYAYVRVRLGVYKLLHREIWEINNGPIPEGYIVVFKDGNSQNITIDNLELITKEENLRRNYHDRYPAEVKDIIRLKGALNRQINKRLKRQEALADRW